MKITYFFLPIVLISFSCSEKKDTNKISDQKPESSNIEIFIENKDSEYAKTELENAKISNEFSPTKVILDPKTAVEISESILFPIYGKENIIKQRPYDVHFIHGYYIIKGTFPEPQIGGTFIIIINSKDGKVIKLTHGE
ncbi:YbbC/YhhH family protein [Chryseobacterium sp. C-71]|uniref:NTF2 fold immunity protein n=1 Tax=Chryseobacterium sp. C-71 TaxID=2893882 RepID=UPI001E5CFE39|nr:NTF2 fold immunity protein [Chryseobacterium sp. C-71]UFH33590.1 YbbC/YhhH family protein [Chryseobacterium sp. C-71]